jgi:membrane bound O-acyltransferase family protein
VSATLAPSWSATPKQTTATPPQSTVPTARLLVGWIILLGGLVGFWFIRPSWGAVAWTDASLGVLFVSAKVATLLCTPPRDRRRLSWGRFVAYLFWPGMQPRHFLPERKPADARPAPTVVGLLLNVVAAVGFLWIIPALMPLDWPVGLRIVSGMVGEFFLVMFVVLDVWALLYRACGVGVEKLWHCPLAAASLADFWGQRWNRVFSGMLREIVFLPLARRIGPSLALCAVFLYSGVMHENLSVGAGSGYGLPFLYFVIRGTAAWLGVGAACAAPSSVGPGWGGCGRRPWCWGRACCCGTKGFAASISCRSSSAGACPDCDRRSPVRHLQYRQAHARRRD